MIFESFSKKSTTALSRQRLAALRSEDSGIAVTEFALVAPFFLFIGLTGLDTANYVVTHMRVSQIAMHVADNASRVGENNVLESRKVYEDDINDLFAGAERYADGLDLESNGRVILSSLQVNEDGGQYIDWQRCFGDKDYESSYGEEGDGAEGTAFPGMGKPGREIQALEGEAVMFVEVAYDYTSLNPISFIDGSEIVYTGSFNVRDSRDLTQVYQTKPASPVARCQ